MWLGVRVAVPRIERTGDARVADAARADEVEGGEQDG